MGVSRPSLLIESTDSMIIVHKYDQDPESRDFSSMLNLRGFLAANSCYDYTEYY